MNNVLGALRNPFAFFIEKSETVFKEEPRKISIHSEKKKQTRSFVAI